MSIVERVANLLGSVPQPRRERTATGEGAATTGPDLIERVVGTNSQRPDSLENRNLKVEGEIRAKTALPTRTFTRTLKIDLERLRQQNIITPDGGRTPIAEGFRRIKRHILANLANAEAGAATNLVMVTSPLAKEGKTFCAINLAISIAMEMDRTVLLVDADVAKPSIPAALGLKADKGLMDLLFDHRIGLADVLCRTNIDKLTLLPAGTGRPHSTELLASDTMRALLQEMAERYHDRVIIFDSPPLLVASEASVLASRMGQIVMVVEAGHTTETALKGALGRIESRNLVGLLLNKGEGHDLGYYYGGYG